MNMHNQNVSNHYDQIANSFDTSRVRIWNNVKSFLNKCDTTKQLKLLDFGCGNGKNMIYAINQGYDCIGFDISNKLLDICKSKNLKVYYGDILEDNIINQKFDKIICIAVIHHLETIELQKKAIKNLMKLLNPNGQLMISLWSLETFANQKMTVRKNIKDYRNFDLGPNYVDWKLDKNNTIKRFYYIHDFTTIHELLEDIPSNNYKITWEFQNWFITINNF